MARKAGYYSNALSLRDLSDDTSTTSCGRRTYLHVLFLEEAGLQNDAAAVDLAVNLFRILSEADALDLCSALDHH